MPSPTTPVLDTFTRANEDPLAGPGWLGGIFSGDAGMRLVSNQARGRAGAGAESYWKTSFPANQELFLTMAGKWANPDVGIAIFSNLQAPGTGGLSGYAVNPYTSSSLGSDAIDAYRIDSGAFTKLGATASGLTFSAGDKLWWANVAGVLTLYRFAAGVWTSIFTRTDTTYGAGYLGFAADDDTPLLDDVGGGAIGSASRMLEVF
jgi:hypothetical protein